MAGNQCLLNPLQRDTLSTGFFDVLHDVLDSEARTHLRKEDTLREVILRSVLTRMFERRTTESDKNQYESLGHITSNMQLFVERVHHKGYSDMLMNS